MIKVYKAGIAMGFDINIASGTTDLGYGAMESIAMHWCHMYSLNPINTMSVTLRIPFKIHSGEKSNKCYQCDFASAYLGYLRRHLKANSGEKSKQIQIM